MAMEDSRLAVPEAVLSSDDTYPFSLGGLNKQRVPGFRRLLEGGTRLASCQTPKLTPTVGQTIEGQLESEQS